MTISETTSQRRKAARKANGSGTIKKRKDGRYEGQVFVRTTSGEFKGSASTVVAGKTAMRRLPD